MKIKLFILLSFCLAFEVETSHAQAGYIVHHVLRNNFLGGSLILNGTQQSVPTTPWAPWDPTIGIDFQISSGDNSTYNAQAIDNQYAEGYQQIFSNWKLNCDDQAPGITTYFTCFTGQTPSSFKVTHNAYFKKMCNLTFQNYLPGSSNHGIIKVNNVPYTSPRNEAIVEQNSVNLEASYNYDFGGGLIYKFINWSDGNLALYRTINVSVHQTYTANYKAYPVFTEGAYRNLTISGSGSDNVIYLDWDEHPNTGVTSYQVWRRIKYIGGVPQGPLYTPVLIFTCSRGTTSYHNHDFTLTPDGSIYSIEYDVRAYYSPDATTSDQAWVPVSGYDNHFEQQKSANMQSVEAITEYNIQNYPNPFNPTTKIEFQLPKAGYVTIKVYNTVGREVTTLVNDYRDVGKYSVDFNGSEFSSGIYFCEMQANGIVQLKKMLMIK